VTSPFTILKFASFDAAAEFSGGWNNLAAACRWPFAEFSWVHACAKHLYPRSIFSIYVVLDHNDSLAAALPLQKSSALGGYTHVGADTLYEATPLLSRDVQWTSCLLKQLAADGHPFVLSRIVRPELVEGPLLEACSGKGRVVTRRPAGVPFLRLPKTVDEFVGGLSSSRRSKLGRKRRRLQDLGNLEFHSTHPDPPRLHEALHDFERLEQAGWKGREGSAITRRSGFHEFFASALSPMAADGRVRVDRLTLNGNAIAIRLGLVSGNAYFGIKPTFDERLQSLSPGHQLTFEAIKQSIVEGLETHEFMGSADAWKLQWTTDVRPTKTWVYYPYNFAGLTRFSLDVAHVLDRTVRRH
jgi:CelD/BcsL family acetyltransferase involved in cellulose biosynthesis